MRPAQLYRKLPAARRGLQPRLRAFVLASLILATLLGACTPPATPAPTSSPTPAATAAPTLPPTPTSPPLAARLNGFEITLAEYQAELALYQAALGKDLAPEDQQRVLDDLIDQALLAQDALTQGFDASEPTLARRRQALIDQLGSPQALAGWLAAHGLDDPTFDRLLRRAAAAAWMRDQIAASLPRRAEQIHARQVLLYSRAEAEQVLAELQGGADFTDLAGKYDPVTRGDLGWFPRGFLLDPALEAAIFALQAGEYTGVIETAAGFHLVLVLERDPARPLDPQARLRLQVLAVQNWLEQRRQASQVEIFVDP